MQINEAARVKRHQVALRLTGRSRGKQNQQMSGEDFWNYREDCKELHRLQLFLQATVNSDAC